MAYRFPDARTFSNSPGSDSPESVRTEPKQVPFAPLELKVIALAEVDPVASIGTPKRFARFFERWFGFRRPSPLANERLEALRRFAVLARVTGGQLPAEEVKRFLAAGFSILQARTLQGRAARPRSLRVSR